MDDCCTGRKDRLLLSRNPSRTVRGTVSLTAAATLAAGLTLSSGPGRAERYWSSEEFHRVVALFPELRSPRPADLKREGYALWVRGELRLPATPATLLEADFDGDGQRDLAVLVETGPDRKPTRHLLVILEVSGEWRRGLLQRLDARSTGDLVWNEGCRALGLDTGTRRRVTRPARLVAEDGVVTHSEPGFVVEDWLVTAFAWNPVQRRFERREPYWYRPP